MCFFFLNHSCDSINRLATFSLISFTRISTIYFYLSHSLNRPNRYGTHIYKYNILITPNVVYKFIQNVAFKRQRLRDWKSCVCVFLLMFFFLLFLCAGERFLFINQPQMNKKSSLNRANCKGCSNSLAFIIHSLSNSFACSLLSSPSLFSRYYVFCCLFSYMV